MMEKYIGGAGGNRTPNMFVSTGFTDLNTRQNRLKLYGFAAFRTISYKIFDAEVSRIGPKLNAPSGIGL
jgi:hypothetical protein